MAKITVDLGAPIKRLSTGIAGLDDMLYGGIPEGSQNMIIGDSGSGKTLLSFQIAYNAARSGIPATILTIDQTANDLLRNALSAFPGFTDAKELMDKGLLNIVEMELLEEFKSRESITYFISEIVKGVRMNDSKLLVFDSLSVLRALSADDRSFTRMVNYMVESFHNIDLTSIITMEVPPTSGDSAKIPGLYEESMFDGVIRLSNMKRAGATEHLTSVIKLRFSKYKSSTTPLEITPNGVIVRNRQASL